MSGDAFTSAHAVGSPPDTAIEDCVRFSARTEPLRTPAQLRQLQFHCGKPPPAAEPSTRIFISLHLIRPGRSPPGFTVQSGPDDKTCPACTEHAPATSAVGDIHRDFHAEPEIDRFGSFPFHGQSPLSCDPILPPAGVARYG